MGLMSIVRSLPPIQVEIIIVNDGSEEDKTKAVIKKFTDLGLDIKYIFTGQRNEKEIQMRNPAIPMNIGIKQASAEVVILTCPEILHQKNTLERIINPLKKSKKTLSIPNHMYFDNTGIYTNLVKEGKCANINLCSHETEHNTMPFLLGIWKKELIDIGGYDEDFGEGYALEDNDLMSRLVKNKCCYQRVDTFVVHLYHGPRCPEGEIWNNPRWIKNKILLETRRDIIIRNKDKKWGEYEKHS
jgi:glycosyltransferase involved in cell wall biosynthesis